MLMMAMSPLPNIRRRADNLLQKLRSQVVVEEGAAGPAKMEHILKLGNNLLNWLLVLQ